MKAMKRRLLSLFMAMVMVCTLVPVALAEDTLNGSISGNSTANVGDEVTFTANPTAPSGYTAPTYTYSWTVAEKNGSGSPAQQTADTDKSFTHKFETAGTYTVSCEVTATEKTDSNVAGGDGTSGTNPVAGTDKTAKGTLTLDVTVKDKYTITLDESTLSLKPGEENTLAATVKKNNVDESNPTVTWTSSKDSVATVDNGKVTAKDSGEATITATFKNGSDEYKATCKVTVASPVTISANPSDAHIDDMEDYVKLTANYSGSKTATYSWKLSGATDFFSDSGTDKAEIIIYPEDISSATRTLTATVTVTDGEKTYKASKDVTLRIDTQISVSATVSDNYFLGDGDNKTNDSIWDKIEDRVYKIDSDYDLESVEFDTYTSKYGDLDGVTSKNNNFDEDELDAIEFIPEQKGDAEFRFTAHVYDTDARKYRELSGMLTITVTDTSSSAAGDITYTAELGEDFYFDVGDFEDYFDDKFSSGSLDYVIFDSASNGKVKDGRSTVDYGSDKYYVDPGKNQDDLADVYFSPNSSSKAMTGKVNFTVYGTKSSQSREGTITIYYLNDSASDITYSTTGGKVTLDPKDFEEAYKEATGSKTAPSNLTIEFQDVPTNGTLTYTGGSRDKDLTKSNVKSNRYTTKSSGSYRLAQLTYSGTKGKDTIDYIAYSGGTAQFSGKVVFNGTAAVPTDVVVGPFYSTAGQPAAFSQNTFTAASSAMSNAVKVRFVAPANGTLTMSGASAAGIDVATSLLNLVSYQPRAGYNGTDQIIFAAYDAKNAVVASGTVNVQVIGNPTTTTPTTPGGSTGGVTSVDEFKDVPNTQGNAWYRSNLDALVKKGVISGRGNGVFDPKGTVTYGEALKMVLEACGHSPAPQTGHWANKYKSFAVSQGWISSEVNVDAVISRNAIADLVGKVLGVAPATSSSPFADSASAYAVALYYTTPQIFKGNPNNGGKPLFKGESSLSRAEVCVVIYQVMDYHTQHTTNTMPDGT